MLTVGRHGDFLTLKRVEHERFRQRAEIEADGEIHEVDLPLAGDFQISNALVAAGLADRHRHAGRARRLAALEHLKGAPGRLELVGTAANGAPVYVDYAHKPDALENVLASVRPFTTGRVIVVFGCGGDRDRGKRPIMGEIADAARRRGRSSPTTIRAPRFPRRSARRSWPRRPAPSRSATAAQAIREAVAMLQAGDTLIVAGKGHEEGQTVGAETLPFSDHEEVRKALRERRGMSHALDRRRTGRGAWAAGRSARCPTGIAGISIDSRTPEARRRLLRHQGRDASTATTSRPPRSRPAPACWSSPKASCRRSAG